MALLKPMKQTPAKYEPDSAAVTNEFMAERNAKHQAARAAMLERKRLQATRQMQPGIDAAKAAALKISNAGRNF